MGNFDDLCVGLPIQFFLSPDGAPTAGIVTAVGNEGKISLWVMNDDYVAPINYQGVSHRGHESAKKSFENLNGAWDFLPTSSETAAARIKLEEAVKEAEKAHQAARAKKKTAKVAV